MVIPFRELMDPATTLTHTHRPACDLSVVVPVYGCADAVVPLWERLDATLTPLGIDLEFVFVEDRGPDESWIRMCGLSARDSRVRCFRLSRNFGQHATITAGLSLARGRHVVVMDCDLQDRPEDIPRLIDAAREGFDVVLARRTMRRDSFLRRWAGRTYFALLAVFTGQRIDREHGTFSLISSTVKDAFLEVRDLERHYLFIVRWLGFSTTSIDVLHADRHSGESSYTLGRLVAHALSGVFFQTTVLLRWIVYLGFAVSLFGLCAAVYLAVARAYDTVYPGWTSVMVLQLVIGGIIQSSIGITGLYVGKVFEQVKGRPLYIISDRIDGLDPDAIPTHVADNVRKTASTSS